MPGDPATMIEAVGKSTELLKKHNKWVVEANYKVTADRKVMKLELHLKGHDQWWIKKRVLYPLAAVLTKAGVKITEAKLVAVQRPEDLRSTRPRASDGRSTPLPTDVMIDHSDMGLVDTQA
jgi:hypothetical protein